MYKYYHNDGNQTRREKGLVSAFQPLTSVIRASCISWTTGAQRCRAKRCMRSLIFKSSELKVYEDILRRRTEFVSEATPVFRFSSWSYGIILLLLDFSNRAYFLSPFFLFLDCSRSVRHVGKKELGYTYQRLTPQNKLRITCQPRTGVLGRPGSHIFSNEQSKSQLNIGN